MHAAATMLLMLCMLLVPVDVLAAQPCSPIVLSTISIQEETLGFSVDAEYPVLCAPVSSQIIRDQVGFRIFDFKKLEPEHDLTDFPHKYWLKTRYAVWPAANGRIASVKLDVSVYTGGAHGNHWPMTWVFDLLEDKPIQIDEIFIDLVTGLSAVSRLVRKPLRSSLGEMYVPDLLEAGIAPMDRNFSNFILTKEGVAFYFAPYQVGPFAAGEHVVTIPYKHLEPFFTDGLKDILKTVPPVAPFKKSR